MIPIAILCGGEGTRARQPINKCFVDVAGKPFVLRIMEQFGEQGFTTFVLCRGPGGTLQALRDALDQLGKRFIVVYGDTYLPIDLGDFAEQWELSGKPCATAVRNGVDAGINGFASRVLGEYAADLVDLQARLSGRTFFYDAPEPWHEVGTLEAFQEAVQWFTERDKENRVTKKSEVDRDGRRKWRPDRLVRDVDIAISVLKEFDRRTIEDLHRRNRETSELDGYAANTAPGSGSRGGRVVLVKDEDGNDEAVPLDSSTESAALQRIEDHRRADPLAEAVDRVFSIIESAARDLREADRKRQVVQLAADHRRGRESSLQGNCAVCGDMVTGVGEDRLKRGYDPKCYFAWGQWKLDHPPTSDPGEDRQRFADWRRREIERMNNDASKRPA